MYFQNIQADFPECCLMIEKDSTGLGYREAGCLLVIGVVFGVKLTWISAQAVTHSESQQSSSFVCSFLPPLLPSSLPSIHPSIPFHECNESIKLMKLMELSWNLDNMNISQHNAFFSAQ